MWMASSPAARRILKLKVGDFVEATTRRSDVLLRPTRVVSEEIFEQELHRRLAEGLGDVKAGRTSGPFGTADDLIALAEVRPALRVADNHVAAPRIHDHRRGHFPGERPLRLPIQILRAQTDPAVTT